MSVKWHIQCVMWMEMLWRFTSNVVLRTVHRLDQKGLHAFANACVINFEKTVLEAAAGGSVDIVTNLGHTISESLKSPWIWWTLTAQ